MMNKKYRIKKSEEIELVMKKGYSKANRYFIVYKYKNPTNQHFRMAVSVGKKIGIAVIRNQIKRRIRAITSMHKHCIPKNFDYFIITRIGCADLDYNEFKKNLEHIYKLMNMIPK